MITKETKVTLLSKTEFPVETVYCEWQASRTPSSIPVPLPREVHHRIRTERSASANIDLSPAKVRDMRESGIYNGEWREAMAKVPAGPFETEVREVFENVIAMKIPVAETIDFVFLIEHLPIACREQMVRHRIGHRFAGKLGADLIPDIDTSTWWSQTMRVMDMSTFATEGEYLTPEWLKENGTRPMPGFSKGTSEQQDQGGVWPIKTVKEFYDEQMRWIQAAYRRLIAAGMPTEDARNLLPLGCQHRLTWKMNLSALMHVMSKRGCWIAQLGMWEPIIRGMIEELATKVDPSFRRLIDPPCIGSDGKFDTCKFKKENDSRVKGEDPYAPCPLYINSDMEEGACAPDMDLDDQGYTEIERAVLKGYHTHEYLPRMERYASLWGRDPRTGERKELTSVPAK